MTEHIYPKKINGKIYYYIQSTCRKKIDDNKTQKKGPGSGKSKVVTESIYLGPAKKIKKAMLESKNTCVEVNHQSFGMITAAYQVAKKIGLIDILKKHIQGKRYGIPRYIFFLVAILNRTDKPASKEKMGEWARKTILPQLLNFNYKKLNSKTFWYVTNDILSEKELQEARSESGDKDDIFVDLDDNLLCKIESDIFSNVKNIFNLNTDHFFYDTTNFFTYIQAKTPSCYAATGHNKEGRHYLKQIGLAVAVESEFGLPFFHRVYRGNSHDASTFSAVIDDLLSQASNSFGPIKNVSLVLDKGNNSEDNFNKLNNKINWIGSLVPSNYKDLLKRPLENYKYAWRGQKYFSVKRKVMGHDCLLVMTYNSKLFRKQKHSLENGIEKCKKELCNKFNSYKRTPKNAASKGMQTIKDKHRHGKFINMKVANGELSFFENEENIEKAKIKMGKNLLFTKNKKMKKTEIIDLYKNKDAIEKGFHLLKDPGMIKQRPIRHWTDTKIRAYCFSCVCALLIIRVMNIMTQKANIEMSSAVLKEELQDLKWVRMIYDNMQTEKMVSVKSSIQKKLFELFNLEEVEKLLTIQI